MIVGFTNVQRASFGSGPQLRFTGELNPLFETIVTFTAPVYPTPISSVCGATVRVKEGAACGVMVSASGADEEARKFSVDP